MNQRKLGGFHSKTRSHGRNQCSWLAASAQKSSECSRAAWSQRFTSGFTRSMSDMACLLLAVGRSSGDNGADYRPVVRRGMYWADVLSQTVRGYRAHARYPRTVWL